MTLLFSLLFGSALMAAGADGIQLEAKPLTRRELPDDFPATVLEKDFAILEIRLTNNTENPWDLDVALFKAFSKKGKEIERALATDIAPELVKFYTSSGGGVYTQQRGYGYPSGPYRRTPERAGVIGTPSVARTVPVTLGTELREKLEGFEIQTGTVLPGETVQGFFYLKSKESGNNLKGGYLQLEELQGDF